jgi:hypothetical protein
LHERRRLAGRVYGQNPQVSLIVKILDVVEQVSSVRRPIERYILESDFNSASSVPVPPDSF